MKLWSINALSNEFGMDRRTMERRLIGLAPDEEQRIGQRTERRWKLSRVMAHLQLAGGSDDDGVDPAHVAASRAAAGQVASRMLTAPTWSAGIVGLLVTDFGATPAQAEAGLLRATYFAMQAFDEGVGHELEFDLGDGRLAKLAKSRKAKAA